MLRIREYSISVIKRNGEPVQHVLTIPAKFIRENNNPKKVLLAFKDDVMIITTSNNPEKIKKILLTILAEG